MTDDWVYVVTDIEVDGPWPGANSMRSFASVAVNASGEELGTFETVLEPLPGAAPNPDTYAWFQTQPEAWAAATTDPRPIADVLQDYVAWLQALPSPRMFAASPIAFDGGWIDYYLRRFTRYGLIPGPTRAASSSTAPACVCAATPRRSLADRWPGYRRRHCRRAGWAAWSTPTARSTTPAATPTCSASCSDGRPVLLPAPNDGCRRAGRTGPSAGARPPAGGRAR